MSSVVYLARYRAVIRRDLPLEIRAGDSDLLPIAIVLWFASVLRVALALYHRQAFDAEPTLAFACVVGLPWLTFRLRNRRVSPRK